MRVDKSNFLPSLQQGDTRIERKHCFQKIEYDAAETIGKKHIQVIQGLLKHNML